MILTLNPPEGGICLNSPDPSEGEAIICPVYGLNWGEFTLQGHMGETTPGKEPSMFDLMLARQYSQVCEHRAQGTGQRAQSTEHRSQGRGQRAKGTGQGKVGDTVALS